MAYVDYLHVLFIGLIGLLHDKGRVADLEGSIQNTVVHFALTYYRTS